jgi:hypothetical protein
MQAEIWFWLTLFGLTSTPGSHTYILCSGYMLLYVNGGLKGLRSQHSVFNLQTPHTHSSLELADKSVPVLVWRITENYS